MLAEKAAYSGIFDLHKARGARFEEFRNGAMRRKTNLKRTS